MVLVNVPVPPPWLVEQLDRVWWFRLGISHHLAGALLLLALCLHGIGVLDRAS